MPENQFLQSLYANRFPDKDLQRKNEIWQEICNNFLYKYITSNHKKYVNDGEFTVLDVACGYGELINNIAASKKIAIDANADSKHFLNEDIEFFQGDALDGLRNYINRADVVITSNFLEHLPDKKTLLEFFDAVFDTLKENGKYIIIGPNLRYLPGEYWDFFDHELGLTHLSLVEALELKNFTVDVCLDKFLPFTTKSALPSHPLLVRMYLKFPMAWRILGKQFFIVASKNKKAA